MAKINIPKDVLPGFSLLASLDSEQIGKLSSYLREMPIEGKLNDLGEFLTTELAISSSIEIVKTIVSFTELLEKPNVDFNELSTNLVDAYKERENETDADTLEALKQNLLEIFRNSKQFRLTIKAKRLISENDNLLQESKIVTDLRLVFDEDLENKKRNAIIIHRLQFDFRTQNESKSIFFSLDIEDLNKLKEEVERAIKKENIIKNDYEDILGFV
jgi:hypothetical protein